MKKYSFLCLVILLQGCYSYKTVHNISENQQFEASKKYTIKTENNTITVTNLQKKGIYYVYTMRGKERTIPAKDVVSIKEKNFSAPKTIGFSLGVVAATTALVIHGLNNMNISLGND